MMTGRGFEELPVNRLDRADRKFLATAVVGNAPILNATDSDWDEQKELTTEGRCRGATALSAARVEGSVARCGGSRTNGAEVPPHGVLAGFAGGAA